MKSDTETEEEPAKVVESKPESKMRATSPFPESAPVAQSITAAVIVDGPSAKKEAATVNVVEDVGADDEVDEVRPSPTYLIRAFSS